MDDVCTPDDKHVVGLQDKFFRETGMNDAATVRRDMPVYTVMRSSTVANNVDDVPTKLPSR
jgi:hypothetical protein